MTFAEAYNYLLSLGNVERLLYHADRKNCDWYLKRLQFFLNLLGNPETKIPHVIHVTGTSGKGSVCLILDSILRAAGKTVGTLTSPHPSVITERWAVNGKSMSKKEFVKLITFMQPKIEQCLKTTPYDLPSYAELMTAFGLYYFAKRRVQWAVLEVACGGRYDATNVIPKKDVAIITNIGLDHVELIGPTKADIAYEKAGIIKPRSKVFTAEKNPKMLKIIQKECRKQKTSLQTVSSSKYQVPSSDLSGTDFVYKETHYRLPGLGTHQIKNAILCIDVARAVGISERAIYKGLANVVLPIRMEIVARRPLVILDGAHNVDKIKTTVKTIEEIKKIKITPSPLRGGTKGGVYKSLHLIVSFAANKNISPMVSQLAKLQPKTIACTRFTSNTFRRASDPKKLALQFKQLLPKAKIEIFLDPFAALSWSRTKAKPNDLLLATGSIFLSGDLRTKFKPSSIV